MPLRRNEGRYETSELQGTQWNYSNEESWQTSTAWPTCGKAVVCAEPAAATNVTNCYILLED
jgi:hypothetical protein